MGPVFHVNRPTYRSSLAIDLLFSKLHLHKHIWNRHEIWNYMYSISQKWIHQWFSNPGSRPSGGSRALKNGSPGWFKENVCNQVQDSGKKQLNKHKQQNESNRQPPQVRIKCVFVFALCFCSVVHCSKSETYLLISITQWPIRGVLVSQNPLTAQNASVLVQSRVLEACDANPLIITNKV